MRIGLIDLDNQGKYGMCFPNLALMKLSAWHKQQGDDVAWHDPLFGGHYDRVYVSKVFSTTEEYQYHIDADEIIQGGSGYAISMVNGKEEFDENKDIWLPDHVEHIMPDYSLYGISHKAYGFLTRGCPRGCAFCHVKAKEGIESHKVADLSEFWDGQNEICLMDPNTFACKDWKDLLGQLKESKARVDFNQGIDIRLMNEEKIEALKSVRTKFVHFAWDRYSDKDIILPKMKMLKEMTGWKHGRVSVYILCNFDTTMEQNLERIQICRDLDFSPYVMLYDKESIPKGHELRKLQRYVNNRFVFWSCKSFEEYQKRS